LWRPSRGGPGRITKPDPEIAATTAAPVQEIATEYFPLFYSSVPATSMQVVRMEVPRASMVAFRFVARRCAHSTNRNSAGDVLVGEDGLASRREIRSESFTGAMTMTRTVATLIGSIGVACVIGASVAAQTPKPPAPFADPWRGQSFFFFNLDAGETSSRVRRTPGEVTTRVS
jgi:hypothetical protein